MLIISTSFLGWAGWKEERGCQPQVGAKWGGGDTSLALLLPPSPPLGVGLARDGPILIPLTWVHCPVTIPIANTSSGKGAPQRKQKKNSSSCSTKPDHPWRSVREGRLKEPKIHSIWRVCLQTGVGTDLGELFPGAQRVGQSRSHQEREEYTSTVSRAKKPNKRCVCSAVSNSQQPYGLQPTRLPCPWHFPGKNTGVACHFLLWGIFLTQGSSQHLQCRLRCKQILYPSINETL